METVKQVVTSGLCTGCGTCAGICPQDAIKMSKKEVDQQYLPEIREDICTQCSLCVKSCPGHEVDFVKLNSQIFGGQPSDTVFGHSLGCYIGYSNDRNLRYSCSSGGISTQILIFALESGLIDGVLMIRMKEGYPLQSEAILVSNKEEVLNNSGSRYFPAAVNEGLKDIMNREGKFAVVGLPCHIHGVRKAEAIFEKLRKKIVLHIGLMCSHTVNFDGTDFLLEKLGVDKKSVLKLNYRGNGWPGSMSIILKNSETKTFPYVRGWNAYWPVFSSFFFTPMRCIMCPDELNEFADISLGDAWISELVKQDNLGHSIIVARTVIGKNILDRAKSSGKISLKSIDSARVKQSQVLPIKFKKNDFNNRMAMLKSIGKNVPQIKLNDFTCDSSSRFSSWIRSLFSYINVHFSSNKLFRSFLVKIPFPVFRLYYGVFKVISLI